jgi:hypothetical protein
MTAPAVPSNRRRTCHEERWIFKGPCVRAFETEALRPAFSLLYFQCFVASRLSSQAKARSAMSRRMPGPLVIETYGIDLLVGAKKPVLDNSPPPELQ